MADTNDELTPQQKLLQAIYGPYNDDQAFADKTEDAHRAQAIREAYYKAVDGLSSLAESLELADAEMGSPHDHALFE
jgi:hypothetical protein